MLKDLARVSAKWKRVKLTIWLTEKHVHGLDCMLRNSPHIEELEIDITTRTPDFIQVCHIFASIRCRFHLEQVGKQSPLNRSELNQNSATMCWMQKIAGGL